MSDLCALYSTLPPHSILTAALVLVPLAVYLLLRVPPAERAVRFSWTVPAESAKGWSSFALPSPSIASHLSSPALIPTPSTGSYITAYAPATGHFIALVPSLSPSEVQDRIGRAERAQLAWKLTTWAQRRKVMQSLLEWCVRDMEGIARVASRDTGKTLVDAAFGEILTTCEKLRWVIAYGEHYLKPERRVTNLILAHKVSEVRYEPLGVVAGIVSWNYSFHNLLSPIIASLFTGNAIVVKPSELVAWSSSHFVEAVRSCLAACGHDPDVVQLLVCLPDAVEALTGDPRIQHITFIGSEEVGKKVAIKAAEVGTPVLLELGGKDPCIILPSADIPYFAPTWMRAAFQAAGQNCIGVERFIVTAPIYSTFLSTMTPLVASLTVGDILAPRASDARSPDVGAMVSDRLFPKLEKLIEDAVAKGARCLVGGKRWKGEEGDRGSYFQPTLLVDVTEEMDIAREEVFAPIMCVMKAKDAEDAARIANGTRYGLGASVFGRNKRECSKVVDELVCGMVCTNDFGVFYLNQSLPFGGAKASGHGRFAGPEGLRGLCNLKAVTVDRFHGWIQTGIPPRLRYPVRDGEGAWTFVTGLVGIVFGSWRGTGKAIWGLVV